MDLVANYLETPGDGTPEEQRAYLHTQLSGITAEAS
jgi:hypothetical protein